MSFVYKIVEFCKLWVTFLIFDKWFVKATITRCSSDFVKLIWCEREKWGRKKCCKVNIAPRIVNYVEEGKCEQNFFVQKEISVLGSNCVNSFFKKGAAVIRKSFSCSRNYRYILCLNRWAVASFLSFYKLFYFFCNKFLGAKKGRKNRTGAKAPARCFVFYSQTWVE